MQSSKAYKILLFGSGFVGKSITAFYKDLPNFHITIASNDAASGKEMEQMNPETFKSVMVDVMNPETFEHLVKECDIAISLIPAFLHMKVANVCLKNSKNLITSSYVSPEMQLLDSEVRAKGLTFLNEIGLDPGIDHLATMLTLEHIKSRGGELKSYYSYTGGLVTPDSCDNPLGYKFTWSPVSVFRALLGSPIYKKNNEIVKIKNTDLLHHCEPIAANKALDLVGFPNRDSTAYQKLYGLEDVETFIRGTLRYRGFNEIVGSWMDIGLINDTLKVPEKMKSMLELLVFFAGRKPMCSFTQEMLDLIKIVAERNEGLNNSVLKSICSGIISDSWKRYSAKEKVERMKVILEGYEWFGLLDPRTKIPEEKEMGKPLTTLEALAYFLEHRLAMGKDEADLIVMIHFFKVFYPKEKKFEVIKSSMVKSGTKGGLSAMA